MIPSNPQKQNPTKKTGSKGKLPYMANSSQLITHSCSHASFPWCVLSHNYLGIYTEQALKQKLWKDVFL